MEGKERTDGREERNLRKGRNEEDVGQGKEVLVLEAVCRRNGYQQYIVIWEGQHLGTDSP